ncbi:hypothetical protein VTO42DRAFT_1273 [Malbranchea cinnamomea]
MELSGSGRRETMSTFILSGEDITPQTKSPMAGANEENPRNFFLIFPGPFSASSLASFIFQLSRKQFHIHWCARLP